MNQQQALNHYQDTEDDRVAMVPRLTELGTTWGSVSPAPPEDLMPSGMCFQNAFVKATDTDRYLYVEGLGLSSRVVQTGVNLPMHHAWNLDLETGEPVDFTWPAGGVLMCGVVFDSGWMIQRALRTGYYGVWTPGAELTDRDVKHGALAQLDVKA